MTRQPNRISREQSGQTLVASLIVLAIIAILAVVALRGNFGEGKSPRKDGLGITAPGLVRAMAIDEKCRSNLNQVRMAVGLRQTTDDEFPASIEETKLGSAFYKCPLGKEPYQYNPADGTVKCPHLGHEKF